MMSDPLFIIATELTSLARILGWTFVFTWVYNNTESVLLTILLHGWVNAVDSSVAVFLRHPLVPVLQHLLPSCVVALALALRAFRRIRFTDEPFD